MSDTERPAQEAEARHTLGDTMWRMLQSKRLKAAERVVMGRTLKVLQGKSGVESIATAGSREAFVPGEVIVRAGDQGQDLFLVLDGEVEVLRHGHVVDRFQHGEIFGEISVLDGAPRSADVVASSRVVVLRIPKSAVDEKMQERLWDYAAERRFHNLPNLPLEAGRSKSQWFEQARHIQLEPGEYEIGSPYIFVYYGEIDVNGVKRVAPTLVSGGVLQVTRPVRLALLQEP